MQFVEICWILIDFTKFLIRRQILGNGGGPTNFIGGGAVEKVVGVSGVGAAASISDTYIVSKRLRNVQRKD